jgi:hypothetical protein
MELLTSLFANLALVAVLFMFAKWFIGYDMRWWLRVQRGKTAGSVLKKWIYLKIKMPKDVFKTPAAMEVVLLTLNQGLGHTPGPVVPPVQFTPFYKYKDDHGIKKLKPAFRLFTYYKNSDGLKKGAAIPRWEYIQVLRENFFLRYISGSLRKWHSLEIISDAGEIYFLLVTNSNYKEIFKQYCYSQYPGVEITEEEEDPLNKFQYTNLKNGPTGLYVGGYKFKPDKDHLPIKTYVDYGLDKEMVKEEFKIDPLVVLLESMAQAKKGEMYWFQILMRPTICNPGDSPAFDPDHPPYHWQKRTQDEIDKLLGKVEEKTGKKVKDSHGHDTDKDETMTMYKRTLSMNQTEKHQVEIMQRNLEKPGFDCQIRFFYWMDKKVFPEGLAPNKVPKGVMTVVNAMKPFNKPNYNEFGFETMTVDLDTPFLDPTGEWSEGKRGWHWKLAKLRAAYYQEATLVEFSWKYYKMIWQQYWRTGNWKRTGGLRGEISEYWKAPGEYHHRNADLDVILNLEELVTLWHFPGKAFGNAESKVSAIKADPPSNLPI